MRKISNLAILFSAILVLLSSCSDKKSELEIKTVKTEKTVKFNNQEDSPTTMVQVRYDYIANAAPGSVEEIINNENVLYAFGPQKEGVTPKTMADNYVADYVEECRAHTQEFLDQGEELGPMFNNELILNFNHFNSSKNSIAFVKDMYIYMGGVHGAQNIIYHTYDLNTGKEMRARDIFLEGSQQELRNIIYEGFKAEYFPGRNQTSQDGGFFNLEENMTLDNTYVFTDKGLLFQYQAYAIAPYSFGMPSVVIPYAKLKNVLNKENAVVKDYL